MERVIKNKVESQFWTICKIRGEWWGQAFYDPYVKEGGSNPG